MRTQFAALLSTLLLLPALALAAPAAATSQVGSLRVTRYGDHGQPLILIPGLGSGAWVWQDTVTHFEKDHVIYTVTLAGFDGAQTPTETNYFDAADVSLLKLIETQHIQKPVLVGHSLGGTLSIRFAEEHSDLLSGVVAVDGLPVFPGTEAMSKAQRQQTATGMQAQIAAFTPKQFAEQQLQYMLHIGVLNPALAKKLALLQGRSSPLAVAKYTAEDLTSDLRPGLKNVSVPLLEISPYYAADFDQGPAKMTEAQKTAYYQSLLTGAPHAEVVSISPSRHFVMFDQPAKFRKTLADFLASLPAR